MADSFSFATLDDRTEDVNRRIASSGRHLKWQSRNGYIGLDEYDGQACIRTLTIGTKPEVADFLRAMMIGIDLSRA
jgi:hypothetical protein